MFRLRSAYEYHKYFVLYRRDYNVPSVIITISSICGSPI